MDDEIQKIEYVYNGRLVEKTGRRAIRTETKSESRRSPGQCKEHILYEIKNVGSSSDITEWVKEDDLYIVEDLKQLPEDYESFIGGIE